MRIAFCDDNPFILEQLETYVKEYFSSLGTEQPEYEAFTSGDALLAASQKADIVFLDVEMPGVSGIQVAARLKQLNPHVKILIVTSYPDYLDDAMRCEVFRYLSKPIDKNRLFRNLKDALYQYSMETVRIPIVTGEGVTVRCSDEIVCLETCGRKVLVHTLEGTLESNHSIEYWDKTLTVPCFYRTHRSYIVNMKYVNTIGKDKVVLRYGERKTEAYLARRKFSAFKNAYLLYMESMK